MKKDEHVLSARVFTVSQWMEGARGFWDAWELPSWNGQGYLGQRTVQTRWAKYSLNKKVKSTLKYIKDSIKKWQSTAGHEGTGKQGSDRQHSMMVQQDS